MYREFAVIVLCNGYGSFHVEHKKYEFEIEGYIGSAT